MKHNPFEKVTLIAITGGPCAGKSTFLAKSRKHLESVGLRVAVLPEVATELICAGFSPSGEWVEDIDFQTFVLRYQLYRERLYAQMLTRQATDKELVILCDRGALDGKAYMPEEKFELATKLVGECSPASLINRYKAVVHLVTAADGAEEHYTLANNSARSEGAEAARELDWKTMCAWAGHPHHIIIDNSTDFNTKMKKAIQAIARVLHMPGPPMEKERKFLLTKWDRSTMLPQGTVSERIIQTYLRYGQGEVERRVRMRTLDGIVSYSYTEKGKAINPGERPEKEDLISESEYKRLLSDRDPQAASIEKVRHHIYLDKKHVEVDEILSPLEAAGKVFAEVELLDMTTPVALPEEWGALEVTGNSLHSMRAIAGLPFASLS